MNRHVSRAVSCALSAGALTLSASPVVLAQDQDAAEVQQIVVTGSRIVRPDYSANSPIASVSSEQITGNSDVTLDTFLNTLPQVIPAGGPQSNNPPNAGQSNIDLRGLGANRNLVLIDGRRAMVSAATMTVDLNTIPQALIENIEVVTGGAGAVYGADAVAGAVNIKLKNNFEGFDLHSSWSNASKDWDAKEYSVDALLGGNFADDRGNVAIGFDYSNREALIKSQRSFAAVATATTSFLPEGLYLAGGNAPSQAAVDQVFANYGVAAGSVPASGSFIGFNMDGTLFSRGAFNNAALDVQNFRYDSDLSVNSNLFPDLYSYNFDAVNILTSPLERRSLMSKMNYKLGGKAEMFAQIGWTEYDADIALAPTPVPTVFTRAPGDPLAGPGDATSVLVEPGRAPQALLIPVTNPFIPADMKALLASRTGDDPNIAGSGPTEPFQMRQRTLSAGLRQSGFNNDVVSYLLGVRGDIVNSWRWEAYASEGHTKIVTSQAGNINTNVLQSLLEAPDGGVSQCEGGFNPFGRQPISQDCLQKLQVASSQTNDFRQQIVQGYVSGDVVDMPAGALSLVLGAEYRRFNYSLDPGANVGPVSGFNVVDPAGGRNSFRDVFTEALIPLARDQSWARSFDLSLGYRLSRSKFSDTVNDVEGEASNDSSYKAELSWQPFDPLRVRTSYQRAVRAPNFAELFNGGSSNPSFFDPCSASSQARSGANGAALTALCVATGLSASAAPTFQQTPGSQTQLTLVGNTALHAEKADTITFGFVFSSPWDGALSKLRGSLDYYSIAIKDPILAPPSPNVFIADCYNYYGNNPSYSATQASCQTILRGGGDILAVVDPNDPVNGNFPTINAGRIKTRGIDLQLDYGFDMDQVGLPASAGSVNINFLASRLLDFKQRDANGLPLIDYAGTVSYFGEGISTGGGGSSYPLWRLGLLTRYSVGNFRFDIRGRWIDSMKNRASAQYPGETAFTGVGSVAYWDVGASWNLFKNASIRLGVNNVMDKQPPVYTPNIQSGTDPSMYDVIGRRIFGQIDVKF
jgi:iron complex outermembrane recepter protein